MTPRRTMDEQGFWIASIARARCVGADHSGASAGRLGCANAERPPGAAALTPSAEKEKMNAWTVGLAGGLLEGAPLRLAAEMARVVDDGPNLHVLPIVTRGATENLNSLLYLRGVDTAIINSDALEEYRIQVPEIQRRITYLLNLFPRSCISLFGPRSRACRISPARK